MNRLKVLRKEKKLTQEELASEVGVSKITILRWENGERQIKQDKAQALADYFNVEVGYLLGYNKEHERAYEFFGRHPEKGSMGIIDLDDLIEAYELGYIKDVKILDELQKDSAVAIKFLESIQQKLLLFGSISKGHTDEFEKLTNFLVDFYENVERRKNKLSNTED